MQTEDKNNYNKVIMKTKTKSPKRGAKKEAGRDAKYPQINSAERRERNNREPAHKEKKGSSSVSANIFHTLYAGKKGDPIHTSSLNAFQPARKQDFLTASKHASTSKGPQVDQNKTPAKMKKATYGNSTKKAQNQANLSSAKVLNHSLGNSKTGSALQNTLSHKLTYMNTPSQMAKNSVLANVRRVGVHQGSTDLTGGNQEQHYAVAASRQMISSPFKQRAAGRNKEEQRTFPSKKPIST